MLPLPHWKGGPQPETQLNPPGRAAWGGGLASKQPQHTRISFPPDATTYAHFLFNAFDADGNGAIHFEVGPCHPYSLPWCHIFQLSRGVDVILEDMAQCIPRGMSRLCLAGPGLTNVTRIWFCSSATLFPALSSIPALLSPGSH